MVGAQAARREPGGNGGNGPASACREGAVEIVDRLVGPIGLAVAHEEQSSHGSSLPSGGDSCITAGLVPSRPGCAAEWRFSGLLRRQSRAVTAIARPAALPLAEKSAHFSGPGVKAC